MAKVVAPEPTRDERDRPVRAMVGLVVGFLVVVVIAVVTVLVPELRDDAGEEDGADAAETERTRPSPSPSPIAPSP